MKEELILVQELDKQEIFKAGGLDPILEKIKAEYLVSRPKIMKLAAQLLLMLESLKNNSLYQLQVEAQRLRRLAAQPNASVQEKVAAAKAQAAVQLAKMTT